MSQKLKKKPQSTRNKPFKDPHAKREAAKYDNPIASREVILDLLSHSTGPMSQRALAEVLGIVSDDQQEALRRRLGAMCRDGQLLQNRRGGFVPATKTDAVKGRVMAHRDGFGFLRPETGEADWYLSGREMRSLLDGDTILARPAGFDRKGRVEAALVKVLDRAHSQLAGRMQRENGLFFVKPDSPRIHQLIAISPDDLHGAQEGQMVVIDVIYPEHPRDVLFGRVQEVLGEHLDPGMEIALAVRNHGIPWQWPDEVSTEAAALPEKVLPRERKHRIDLRGLPLVTIDGEDARDFDDAVYCEKRRGGWTLYVAIADVSHYVQVGSPLDREAENRATSVYFPGSVVPMLPEKLSNGLCSLNPDVDRLCMACELQISRAGRVTGFRFYEAVMHSHARLTYTKVGLMLESHCDEAIALREQYSERLEDLRELHALYRALRNARDSRGAIDFETVETKIQFSDDRKIERIVPVVRNDAHKIIEECMLAANTCAATLLARQKLPALFRVHEGPREEKLKNLRSFLGELGLTLSGGDTPEPADYQALLEQISERPDKNVIQTMLLRSMSQAVYQPDNIGHFGLGYPSYAHFTSPIRRYPDLLVHRAIRYIIRNHPTLATVQAVTDAPKLPAKKIYPYDEGRIDQLGVHTSACERRADEASRDVTAWLKCHYLQDRVGDSFDGVITAVTGFGLFVELTDVYVEGLVHVTALDRDYYQFDQAGQRLIGERTRKVYRLGDKVRVQVVRVNLDERKVDLEMQALLAGYRAPKQRTKAVVQPEQSANSKPKTPKPKTSQSKTPKPLKARSSKAVKPGNTTTGKSAASDKTSPKRSPSKRSATSGTSSPPNGKSAKTTAIKHKPAKATNRKTSSSKATANKTASPASKPTRSPRKRQSKS